MCETSWSQTDTFVGAKLDNLLRDTPKHLSAVCKVLNLSCGLLAQRLLSDKHVQ